MRMTFPNIRLEPAVALRFSRDLFFSLSRALVLLALLMANAPINSAAQSDGPASTQYSEEEVKAAILVGFAKMTERPPGAFPDGQNNYVIGILGRDTLGEKATGIFTAATSAKGQKVVFKVVNDATEARECHVLFVPRPERRRGREMIESLKDRPILTVGEADEFLDQNGMVKLVPKDGLMKFEINLDAAKAVNLRIPAKVLEKALKVRGKYD